MKKLIIILMCLFLLVGCTNNQIKSVKSENKSIDLFKKEIKDITLAEMKAKKVPDEISEESIDAIINPMIEQSGIFVVSKFYSEPSAAMIKSGNEAKGGTKIWFTLSGEADKESMKKFLTSLANIDSKFTLVKIDVNKSVDKYKVDLEIVFYCYKNISELNSNNNLGTVSRIETYKEEESKVVLRDSDFFGSVRNVASDISAVRFGRNDSNNTAKLVSKDRNQIENINIELTKEGKKYYFRYYIDDEMYPRNDTKEEFKPKGKDILIDILSSERTKANDLVGVNLIITNTTDKKVDVKVFEDEDSRVKVIYQ